MHVVEEHMVNARGKGHSECGKCVLNSESEERVVESRSCSDWDRTPVESARRGFATLALHPSLVIMGGT